MPTPVYIRKRFSISPLGNRRVWLVANETLNADAGLVELGPRLNEAGGLFYGPDGLEMKAVEREKTFVFSNVSTRGVFTNLTLQYDTYYATLGELEPGDDIYITFDLDDAGLEDGKPRYVRFFIENLSGEHQGLLIEPPVGNPYQVFHTTEEGHDVGLPFAVPNNGFIALEFVIVHNIADDLVNVIINRVNRATKI